MVEFGKTHDGKPMHPGRILLVQAMEPLGISRNQLARDIDVPVGRISDITNGKRGITADTALRLGRYFGTGPELWLRLQAEYDLYVARTTTWPAIESRVRVLEARPADVSPVARDEDRVADDAMADADELSELPEVPSLTAISGETLPQDMDEDLNEERSAPVWTNSKPVSEFASAQRTAEQAEDGDDEELGIPPVPGATSRIVSG